MKKIETKKIILIVALFIVTLLLTCIVHFDYPSVDGKVGGYWTLGDVGVYLAAALIGGPLGAFAAALASALGDLILKQWAYAPATFVIKGCAALFFGYYIQHGRTILTLAKGAAYGGLMMAIGYFLYDIIIRSSYQIASFAFILNVLQALAAGIIATPLLYLIGGKSYRKGQGFIGKRDDFKGWNKDKGRNLK